MQFPAAGTRNLVDPLFFLRTIRLGVIPRQDKPRVVFHEQSFIGGKGTHVCARAGDIANLFNEAVCSMQRNDDHFLGDTGDIVAAPRAGKINIVPFAGPNNRGVDISVFIDLTGAQNSQTLAVDTTDADPMQV